MEVDLLVDGDLTELLEALPLVQRNFGGDVAQDGVVPLVLLDELLAQALTAGTAVLQVHEAGAEHPHVPAPLQDILAHDPLSAITADGSSPHQSLPRRWSRLAAAKRTALSAPECHSIIAAA